MRRRFRHLAIGSCLLASCVGSTNATDGERPLDKAVAGSPIPEQLPRSPGESTRAGFVEAVAIAEAVDGLVFTGTVTDVRQETGEFGLRYQVATIDVETTFIGTTRQRVEIRGADELFTTSAGARHLIAVGQDEGSPGRFNVIDHYLFDWSDGRWISRAPSGEEPLRLAEGDVAPAVAEVRRFLADRLKASRAQLTVDRTADQLVVTGYADGATIETMVCAATDDFDPISGIETCDPSTRIRVETSGSATTIEFRRPEQITTMSDETVRCSSNRCAVAVYDAAWPAKVFAVVPL